MPRWATWRASPSTLPAAGQSRGAVSALQRRDDLLLQGRHDEAGNYFLRALSLDPTYAQGHDGLGQVRLRQGNTSEALQHFREAVGWHQEARTHNGT
jgi:tetratricopeptide (TPR) repeat protein